LTLIETGKTKAFPIFLVGKEYWSPLIDWMEKHLLCKGCIDQQGFNLFTVSDDLDEIAEAIQKHYKKVKSLENF